MEYEFCGVFLFKGKLYLGREEKVGGPRRLIFPPEELPREIDGLDLGYALFRALGSYRDARRAVLADEWEMLNQRLLEFFGEKTVAAFERKKKDVTVRRHVPSGEIRLFGPKDQELVVPDGDPQRLGEAAKGLLGLPS